MKLIETLKKIGFSDKEAQIYLQLIRLGPQSASVLSRHTKINRTTIYDILENLQERGIAQSIKKSGSTLFSALHPSELIRFLEREKTEMIRKIQRQQETVKGVLSELISLEGTNTTKPKVTFFEGEKGMREAYEDTLNSKDEILAYANVEDMHKGLPHFFPEYYQRRAVENEIHIKAIMPNNKASSDRAKQDEIEDRESILIPKEEYEFTPEINIYNDKVLITSWREKLAILIESKEISDFHRKMYKLCWARAKNLEG
jgi:sugar-specific transcriptional regulator TrmB